MPFLYESPLGYASEVVAARVWRDTRDPTSADYKNFDLGVIWINTSADRGWLMVDRTATSGTWIQMAVVANGILTITGDSGGAVGPDGADNINIVTGSNLTLAGDSTTNTLTLNLDSTVPLTFTEDAGSATASSNNVNIVGGMGVTTSGAGSTVTITAHASVPLTFTEDAGTATPTLNNLNVVGTGGITTSGAGATVTITTDGSVIGTTITGDTGGALSPTAGNWDILGGTGCATSGSGSTLTINVVGGGLEWTEVAVVGPTQTAVNIGYVTNSASVVQLLLPLTAAFGSMIRVVGKGSGGWQINQNAGQSIALEDSSTTVGVTGTLQSSSQRDCITLLCTTADTGWTIIDGIGNFIFN